MPNAALTPTHLRPPYVALTAHTPTPLPQVHPPTRSSRPSVTVRESVGYSPSVTVRRLSCQVHVYVLYAKARYVYPVRTVRPLRSEGCAAGAKILAITPNSIVLLQILHTQTSVACHLRKNSQYFGPGPNMVFLAARRCWPQERAAPHWPWRWVP